MKNKSDYYSRLSKDMLEMYASKNPKKWHQKIEKEIIHNFSDNFIWMSEGSTIRQISPQAKQKIPAPQASKYSPKNPPNIAWSDIAGLTQAKADLQEAIELPFKHQALYKFYSQKPLKGILLAGPPGCGKTLLGKAAATAIQKMHKPTPTAFLYVKGPELFGSYLGETEKNIRNLFASAREHYDYFKYPAIIFIDEADSLLACRSSRSTMTRISVPQFLTEMDGLEDSHTIVMLASNRPDVLDEAVVRDGRIDRKIYVDRPDELTAREILDLNLRDKPAINRSLLVDHALSKLFEAKVGPNLWLRDHLTGAMLANLVSIAISSALNRDIASGQPSGLLQQDIDYAIDRLLQSAKVAL